MNQRGTAAAPSQGHVNKDERGCLTVFIGIGKQDAEFVTEHLQFDLDVRAVLLGKQRSQLSLNLGLLVE